MNTPMVESTEQGDSQLVRSGQGEVRCSGPPALPPELSRHPKWRKVTLVTLNIHRPIVVYFMTVPRSQSHTGRGSETRPTGEAFLKICVFFYCQVCPVQRARPTFPRDSRRHCTTTSPQPQPGSVHVRHFTHTHAYTHTVTHAH